MKTHTYSFNITKIPNPITNRILQFLALFFCISFSIFSQVSVKEVKNTPNPKEPAKVTSDEKKEELKPLKMETGTVTVDPQIVSSDFKRTNLRHLRKLKSSFLNYEMADKFNAIMKDYVDASIKFQEKNYITSRRIFEKNYTDLNAEAQNFSKKYSEVYNKLYADASFQLVDLKVNSDTDESIYPVLEKQLVIANEFNSTAQVLNVKTHYVDGLYEQKNAIQSLFKIYYTINKHKNKNLKVSEKVSKNLLLDDDFIPKEFLKEYDDSLGLVFSVREKEREREREQIKTSLINKYGDLALEKEEPAKTEPKKDDKDSKTVNDTKDEKSEKVPAPAKK